MPPTVSRQQASSTRPGKVVGEAHRKAMADIEARSAPFRVEVGAVLRKIRIAGAREESRRVVHRLAQRVGHQHRAAERIALLKACLEAVELRTRARLDERDVGESRIRTKIQLRGARPRLVDVARGDQVPAPRPDIRDFRDASGAKLPLQRDVELVQVRRAQIPLNAKRRVRRRNRKRAWKRIAQRDGPERRRKVRRDS